MLQTGKTGHAIGYEETSSFKKPIKELYWYQLELYNSLKGENGVEKQQKLLGQQNTRLGMGDPVLRGSFGGLVHTEHPAQYKPRVPVRARNYQRPHNHGRARRLLG